MMVLTNKIHPLAESLVLYVMNNVKSFITVSGDSGLFRVQCMRALQSLDRMTGFIWKKRRYGYIFIMQ